MKGAAGDVRAWDARTGKLVWTFHSVPRPGEKGHETWEGDSWRQRTGANMWNMATVDTQRGIAYLAFGFVLGILVFATMGTIAANPSPVELVMLTVFGVLGFLMRRGGDH